MCRYFFVVCVLVCGANIINGEDEDDVKNLVKFVSEMKAKLQEDGKQQAALTNEVLRLRSEIEEMKQSGRVRREDSKQQTALRNEVLHLRTEVEEMKKSGRKRRGFESAGTTYIRWGRTTCGPEDVETLYRGHAAGSHHYKQGGGSNHLCLHERPQWLKSGKFHSSIYGIELELFSYSDIFSTRNHGGYSLYNYPSPCAACYVPTRSAVIMIPARITCPSGWTKEYQGYLLADGVYASRPRSQYTCWDEAPESASGGTAQNQAVIYPVEAGCGSLPCSRFVSGRAVTCVVCTK